jgi:tetratricopeptide (TPR) repeat protein
MSGMADALWSVYESQKEKGLGSAMRQTLGKMHKAGFTDARWMNAMGELALSEKQPQRAVKFFKHAVGKDDLPEYRLNLANALFESGETGTAIHWFLRHLEKSPKDHAAHLNLMNCLVASGREEEAEQKCRIALLDAGSEEAAYRNALGHILSRRGDPVAAFEQFDAAYRLSPGAVETLFNRGNMRHRTEQLSEALEDYRLCQRKDETFLPAFLNGAALSLQSGDREGCRIQLEGAKRLDGNHPVYHELQGRLHLLEGDLKPAKASFNQCLKRDSEYAAAWIGLARIAHLTGEEQTAKQFVEKILSKQDSVEPSIRGSAIGLLAELGHYGLCLRHLDRNAASVAAGGLEPDFLKIVCLWKSGRLSEAIRNLEKWLEQETLEDEKRGSGLALLGRLLVQNQATDLAESRLYEALKLNPAHIPAALQIAQILGKTNKYKELKDILEVSLQYHPNNLDLLYDYACCLARLNDKEGAQRALRLAREAGFDDLALLADDPDLQSLGEWEHAAKPAA